MPIPKPCLFPKKVDVDVHFIIYTSDLITQSPWLDAEFFFAFITTACLHIKTPLDKHCNFYQCKIEIVLSSIDSYTLELLLLAMKADISCFFYFSNF